jgi:uncharacterized protein (TIGR03118 family)
MHSNHSVALRLAASIGIAGLSACGGGGSSMTPAAAPALTDTALTSNGVIAAAHSDANLQNAWGLASAPNGDFWVADNNSNELTIYDGTGTTQGPVISVAAGANGPANPTGEVYNPTTDFVVTTGAGSAPAQFIAAGEGGTITAWATPTISGTTATVVYDDGAGGAVYKGLALMNNGTANFLYATDLHNAKVDMFDATFQKVPAAGGFADATIPAGFAPFGIHVVNNQLWVTYAKQDATAHDEVLGAGLGYVNVFDANGNWVKRFASAAALNAPWGIALAPAGFGPAAGDLLIGNFGDGAINRYDPMSGNFLGPLVLASGNSLLIPGLWALAFGNGALNQPAAALFYTAGPTSQVDGVFGRIDVVAGMKPPCSGYGC